MWFHYELCPLALKCAYVAADHELESAHFSPFLLLYIREEEDCCISRRKLLPSHQSKTVVVRKAPLFSVTLPHTDTFPEVWKDSS